jgi:hypothetical protein
MGKVLVQTLPSAQFQYMPDNVVEADDPYAIETQEELANKLNENS